MIESYTDSVQRYEAVFTKQFADRGFKWDVYVKTGGPERVHRLSVVGVPCTAASG